MAKQKGRQLEPSVLERHSINLFNNIIISQEAKNVYRIRRQISAL